MGRRHTDTHSPRKAERHKKDTPYIRVPSPKALRHTLGVFVFYINGILGQYSTRIGWRNLQSVLCAWLSFLSPTSSTGGANACACAVERVRHACTHRIIIYNVNSRYSLQRRRRPRPRRRRAEFTIFCNFARARARLLARVSGSAAVSLSPPRPLVPLPSPPLPLPPPPPVPDAELSVSYLSAHKSD